MHFAMTLTLNTFLSLLNLIKRLKLHVLATLKLTLFSWGIIDYTTGISSKSTDNTCFQMMLTDFFEILLQTCLFHCNGPIGPKYANAEKTGMERVFIAKHCL